MYKSIIGTFLTQIINTLIWVFSSVLVARLLGASGRGEFVIVQTIAQFLVLFFGMSFNSSLVHFVSSKRIDYNRLVSVFYTLSLVLLILSYFFLLFFWDSISTLQSDTNYYRNIVWGLFIITLLYNGFTALLRGLLNFKAVNVINVSISVFLLVGYIILYVLSLYEYINVSVKLIVLFFFGTKVVQMIIPAIVLFKMEKLPIPKLIGYTEIKAVASYTLLAYVINLIQFLMAKMDFWFVSKFLNESITGMYSLSVSILITLNLLPTSIATVLLSYSSNDDYKMEERTIQALKVNFYTTLFLGITAASLGYFFIPAFYGQEFLPSRSYMFYLLPGSVMMSFSVIISSYFFGKNKLKGYLFILVGSFLIYVLGNVFLIPKIGISGAIIVSNASKIMVSVFMIGLFIKITGFKLRKMFIIKKQDILYYTELLRKKTN